jgi:ABC-2 type transport system ATP-binding protein
MVTSPVIQARKVVKTFSGARVLDEVDIDIAPGELCGVVGADGAGKTTLLRCIAGLYRCDSGDVRPGRAQRARVGFCPQGFHMYADLTVDENVEFYGSIYGLDKSTLGERRDELLSFTGLDGHRSRLAGELSGGMQQKLTLACSMLHRPPILLLDEPTTGVDPLSRRDFWQLIEVLHASGTTILMATAYFDEVERCERVVFLHEGRVLASGSVDELAAPGADLEATFRERMLDSVSAPGTESPA